MFQAARHSGLAHGLACISEARGHIAVTASFTPAHPCGSPFPCRAPFGERSVFVFKVTFYGPGNRPQPGLSIWWPALQTGESVGTESFVRRAGVLAGEAVLLRLVGHLGLPF